jgi:hypothetical protein
VAESVGDPSGKWVMSFGVPRSEFSTGLPMPGGLVARDSGATAASSTARRGVRQAAHEDKIAGGGDERGPRGDFVRAAVHGSSKTIDHLHLAEAFLNLLADALAGLATRRSGGEEVIEDTHCAGVPTSRVRQVRGFATGKSGCFGLVFAPSSPSPAP